MGPLSPPQRWGSALSLLVDVEFSWWQIPARLPCGCGFWLWMLDGARLAARLKYNSAPSAFGLPLQMDVSVAQVYVRSECRHAEV